MLAANHQKTAALLAYEKIKGPQKFGAQIKCRHVVDHHRPRPGQAALIGRLRLGDHLHAEPLRAECGGQRVVGIACD